MPDLELHVHHITSQAVLVSDDGDKKRAEWLALSRIEPEGELTVGKIAVIDVPTWLAQEKGLI